MILIERLRKEIPSCSFSLKELREYLLMAVDEFNACPPTTSLTLEEITKKKEYIEPILKRAVAFACFALILELTSVRDKLLSIYNEAVSNKKDFCVLVSKRIKNTNPQKNPHNI